MSLSKWFLLTPLLAVALIAAMPGKDSIWTDEGQTYHYATQPDFHTWRVALVHDGASEALMPGGMLAPWLAARAFPTSEWSMRAVNVLWAVLALVPLVLLMRQLHLPWLPILFAVQPFLWFYTNEARPYVMQIAEGAWLLLALLKWGEPGERPERWCWCFAAAGVLLCATSLLGVIPFVAVFLIGLLAVWKQKLRPPRSCWLPLALSCPPLLLLGAYYLWTLHRGAESSKAWPVNISNVAFSFYELFGFSGLGAGRAAMRGAAVSATGGVTHGLLQYLPAVAALAILYALVAIGYYRALRNPRWRYYLLATSGLVILSVCGLGVLAAVAHFPFWGRHLAPIFPAIVLIVAISLASVDSRPWVNPSLAAALCLILLASSLQLKFSARHAKDDYRSASHRAIAELNEGKRVWWFADFWAARYYGLNITIADPWASGVAIRPDQYIGRFDPLPSPDLIVLSKPDIYDKTGNLQLFMQRAGFHQTGQVQSFAFFER